MHWDLEPIAIPLTRPPATLSPAGEEGWTVHWDCEPLAVWSPGFSRTELFVPPEGGTPNQRRFMESPLSFFRMHWDHEPTSSDRGRSPSAARGKRQTVAASPKFRKRAMCCEPGRFALRFMESLHSHLRMLRDQEPRCIGGPRLWSQTQPQRVGMGEHAAAGASRTAALRFMESLQGFWTVHPP